MVRPRMCVRESREEIVLEVDEAFSQPLIAVQIGFDTIRVTFHDLVSFRTAHAKTHVPSFGINCVVQGGGPPLTMVHIFDYPAEFSDDPVKQVLSGFGEVRNVLNARNISADLVGTRLVLMAFCVIPPRLVNIDGYFCCLRFKGQPIICNLCNVQGHKSADCPNRGKCRRCGVSGHFARFCPTPWGSERSNNTGAAPVGEFPPLSSDSDADFSSGGSVETPVRPAGMKTRSVEDTPSHDAGRGIDVNNINNALVTGPVPGSVTCSSSATSAVVGPAASFDVGVNSNIDSSDLSPVNNNMTIIGAVTAANSGANECSDLNVNAFSATTSGVETSGAPLNVEVNPSCSKVTAAASGASVYSNLTTFTVETTANSGVNVNTQCDSNIDANSSGNKTAAATSSEDVHSISKTVDIEATANSGVNVNTLCNSNIEVNSTSNKTAAVTSCGNTHSISKTVNVEATANSGHSSSNVNVDVYLF